MSVMRRLAELQAEAQQLGIEVVSLDGKKLGKQDYVKALRKYYLDMYRERGLLTKGREWVNQLESPMLAVSPTSVKPENVEEAWNNEKYAFQEKLDGCRCLIHYHPEEGFTFFSRNVSVTDYCFGDYTNKIKGFEDKAYAGLFKKSFCLDSELVSLNPSINGRVVTETVLEAVVALLALNQPDSHAAQIEAGSPLRFKVFDCIMLDGKSLMNLPLSQRDEIAGKLCSQLNDRSTLVENGTPLTWFEKVPLHTGTREDKQRLFDEIVNSGREGLVLKHLEGVYLAREARGNGLTGWLKAKKTVSAKLGDEIDAFVTGFKLGTPGTQNEGLVAALDFSVYLTPSGRLHKIASCSNLPLELKKSITVLDENGQPTLRADFYNKVAAVEGMDISSSLDHGSGALVHARIVRWREGMDGKNPTDCTFPESLLNDLVL